MAQFSADAAATAAEHARRLSHHGIHAHAHAKMVKGSKSVEPSPSPSSSDDLGEILLCFLDFFGSPAGRFDSKSMAIRFTPSAPGHHTIALYALDQPSSVLVINDPFSSTHNVSKSVFAFRRVSRMLYWAGAALTESSADRPQSFDGLTRILRCLRPQHHDDTS